MKRMFIALLALMATAGVMAQELDGSLERSKKKFMNLYLGGLATHINSSHKVSQKGYEFEYNTLGGFAAFEYCLRGYRYMTELSAHTADNEWEYYHDEDADAFTYGNEDFVAPTVLSAMFYAGATPFGYGHRFQLPIYVGFGGDYMTGHPNNVFYPSIAFKLRGTFYLGNNFGIFAGGNVKWSMMDKKNGTSSDNIAINHGIFGIEAGITLCLGRKK